MRGLQKKNFKKICIFLQSPHQVDMKNIVECQKDFFAYFNALETQGGIKPQKKKTVRKGKKKKKIFAHSLII